MAHVFPYHRQITPEIVQAAIDHAHYENHHKYHSKQKERIVSKSALAVGIDPGVKTGIATALNGDLQSVASMTITAAMEFVLSIKDQNPTLYIEDARKRTWFGGADDRMARSGAGTREGVGSIKRDCSIWEQWCIEQRIAYHLIHPAANKTKLDAQTFGRITGWAAKTNEHGRDAGMLIWERK